MRPLLGSMSRLIIFRVVVLPQPEGPTSMVSCPVWNSIVKSRTASCAPYRLLTPSSRIIRNFYSKLRRGGGGVRTGCCMAPAAPAEAPIQDPGGDGVAARDRLVLGAYRP